MEDNLNYELIGKRIRKRRNKANFTQAAIAEKIGASEQYISKIEKADSKPSLACIVNIANALETTVDHLLMDNVAAASTPHLLGEAQKLFEGCTPEEIFIAIETAKTVIKSIRIKKLQPAEPLH